MASRIFLNNLRNLPVKTAAVSEGNITRSNIIGPDGGRIDGVVSRASPVVKGDIVKAVAQTAVKNAIIVQKGDALNGSIALGIAVSDPQGIDDVTASGSAAAYAQMRRVDVAFFGLAIVEFTLTAAVAQAVGQLFIGADTASAAAVLAGGSTGVIGDKIVLTYGAASGDVVAVLVGAHGIMAAHKNA